MHSVHRRNIHMPRLLCSLILALTALTPLAVGAQSDGKAPWNSYGDRIKSSQEVSPLGPDLFGDQISLSNGGLSFTATDVSVPGNSSVPVALTRRYQVKDWRHRIADGMLKDWDLDLPNVSGTFATEWVGQHFTTGAISAARCSNPNRPPLPTSYEGLTWQDFWRGVSINIPGVTGGELLRQNTGNTIPSTGGPYLWMTNDQVHVMCLPSIKNGSGAYGNGGEGFLAVAPDGTKYWFDWMARSHEPPLKRGSFVTNYSRPGPIYWTQVLPIYRYALYATRIEDRFGNAVELTYSNAWNQAPRLTSIKDAAGGEGRQITITYSGDAISSVTDGTRTWNYSYGTTGSGRGTLTSVAQSTSDNPNSNAWAINFAQFTNAEIIYPEANTEGARNCFMLQDPSNYSLTPVGTITHPSGAIGTFTMKLKEHNRSNVPVNCDNIIVYEGAEGNDENDDTPRYPFSFISLTLDSKSISGPNLSTAQWTYSYDSDRIDELAYGATPQSPRCTLSLQSDCMKPVCLSEACAGRSRTTVRGPNNEWTHYSHGNAYRYNEGKLLAVDVGQGTGPTYAPPAAGELPKKVVNNSIQRTTTTYDLSRTAQAVPSNWGGSQQLEGDGFQDEYRRPWTGTVIRLQGVDFSRQATALDSFDRPTTEVKASIGGSNTSRTDTTEYHDNLAKWVIGQVARTTVNSTQTSRTEFNALAQPIKHRGMADWLIQEVSYHANGVPHTVKDGKGNTTAATNWYRGVPRLITYADTTTHSAVVNALGWISQVTDQNGFATNYDYDTVGRLKLIQYPIGDSVAWNSTNLSFAKLTATELGFPAGTWRLQTNTGNGYKRTYFDAMWRPRLTHEYDSANTAGTSRYNAWTYDHDGRTTFSAYPTATATSTASLTQGVWTSYDRLGRTESVAQDSELGTLVTLNEYLAGFQTRVTNPRAFATTTSYQTFGSPDTSSPILIAGPAGQTTTIQRDLLGRTTSLTRVDSGWAASATRSYVYDAVGRLCKLIEPEAGATVTSYDAASNLLWSASGLALPDTAQSSCDAGRTTAFSSGRRSDRVYDPLNRLTNLSFPDSNGNQTWTYTPDGLPATITTLNDGGGNAVVNVYSYNKRRLLVSESIRQPGWYSWDLDYGYNANGHLASQSYPTGLVVANLPNALGQATQAGSYATGVQYHPNGAIKQFTYGNGLVHSMTQNARQLPLQSVDSGGALSQRYQYDDNGNVDQILDNLDNARTKYLVYDAFDRLTDAGAVVFSGDHWHRFTYDHLDNLRSWTLAGVKDFASYQYNAANRLTSIRNTAGTQLHSFGYDVQGNITSKSGQGYAFDYGNRLRGVTGIETYRYDGHGRRVEAKKPNGSSTLWQYSQDGKMLFSWKGPTAQTTHEYVYLGGSLVATIDHNWPSNSVIATKYQHTDALGSPVAVTNESGAVIERTNYDPFGGPIGKIVNGVGYTGHVMDGASGLTYMQQRYYDPAVGRFLSVDPVAARPIGDNFNRYWYANNNPHRYLDPDGRETGSAFRSVNNATNGGPVNAPPRSPDDWLGPVIGAGLAVVSAPAAVYGTVELGLVVLANPAIATTLTNGTAELLAGDALGGGAVVASSAVSGLKLGKQLASEAQLAEVMTGNGVPIVGGSTGRELRAAEGLSQQYGGDAGDWTKVTSSSHTSADGQSISTHAYQNQASGLVVEPKTKIVEEGQ